MVSSTLCPAVHILDSQIVYSRTEGIADHYWPWAVFFFLTPSSILTPSLARKKPPFYDQKKVRSDLIRNR